MIVALPLPVPLFPPFEFITSSWSSCFKILSEMRFGIEAVTRREFTLRPFGRDRSGNSPFKTTASESPRSIRSKSLDSSNVCIAPRNIPEPEWDWPSVSGSSNGQGEESGWSLNRPGVRRFTLRSRSGTASEEHTGRGVSWILLVEDNPADAGLIRRALEEHGVEGSVVVAADGE